MGNLVFQPVHKKVPDTVLMGTVTGVNIVTGTSTTHNITTSAITTLTPTTLNITGTNTAATLTLVGSGVTGQYQSTFTPTGTGVGYLKVTVDGPTTRYLRLYSGTGL